MAEHFDFRKYVRKPETVEAVKPPLMEEENTFEAVEEVTPDPTLTLLFEEEYICGFCEGKGERPLGSICPVCRGSKTTKLAPPVAKCALCKGRGDEKPRSQVTCSACGGKGYIAVTEPIEKCRSCRGTGASGGSKLACMRCRGAGVITCNYSKTIAKVKGS